MNRIDSSSNPFFKKLRTLLESRGIKKEELFFVFGKKPIEETLQAAHTKSRFILATQEMSEEAHRLNRFLPTSGETIFLANPLFEELNIFGINYPLLVCIPPTWGEWQRDDTPTLICPFGNPQNLGGALRTALAFGFKVILTKESAHPLHPKCMRALSGNIFAHNIQLGPSVQEFPPDKDLLVVDQGGQNISRFRFPQNVVMLIGEEGQGVPKHLESAIRLSIPIQEQQESLNATSALTIVAYQYRTQFPL